MRGSNDVSNDAKSNGHENVTEQNKKMIKKFNQSSSEIPVPGAAYNNYIKLCEADLNIRKQQLEIKM